MPVSSRQERVQKLDPTTDKKTPHFYHASLLLPFLFSCSTFDSRVWGCGWGWGVSLFLVTLKTEPGEASTWQCNEMQSLGVEMKKEEGKNGDEVVQEEGGGEEERV